MMTSSNSITPYPMLNLPSNDFSWIPEHSWSSEMSEQASQEISCKSLSLMRSYQSQKWEGEQHPNSQTYILWNKSSQSLAAWAKLDLFSKKFTSLIILSNMGRIPEERHKDALAYLVSLGFVYCKADSIRLIRLDSPEPYEKLVESAENLSLYTSRSACSFQKRGLLKLATQELLRVDWLNSDSYKSHKDIFQGYLSRQKRMDLINKKASSPKRRGFLSRLFRPRVDDSLF